MSEPTSIQRYALLKEEILGSIEGVSILEDPPAASLDELARKVRTNTMNLVVVGQFKRGKTCLINALIGADLLPTGVVPLTSIVTVLTYREVLHIDVSFLDGNAISAAPQELVDYVTEPGNPRNTKQVKEVLVGYPSAYLKDGVRLVDTPGVGSVYLHNTDVAYRYLPNCDAALFLLSVEQPLSQAELDFLKDVRQFSDRIFFLLNKIDNATDDEIQESVEFSRQTIHEATGLEARIYPISAKLALEGKLTGSDSLLERSRLPAFSEVLSRFLIEEKGKVLLLSVTNNLLRVLSQARFKVELELESLTCPLDELRQKMMVLQEKKEELLKEQQDFDILLDGELNRLIATRLDQDLHAFKEELVPRMEQGFDAFLDRHRDLSLKDLNDAIEAYVADRIEPEFTAWRTKEDAELARAGQAVYDRFARKMNRIVDALMEFSSQLFAVPFSGIEAESLWTVESGYSSRLREEPVGLDMLADSLTQVFPKYISQRFQKLKSFLFRKADSLIIRKRKRHMLEMIEKQAGRMRHAFIVRLTESTQRFRHEMVERMRATLEGIGSALENGVNQRIRGEEELLRRQTALTQELLKMRKTSEKLMHIRESILREGANHEETIP